MQECTDEIRLALADLAERVVQRYVCGLLRVDWLLERLIQAWRSRPPGEEAASSALELLARGLCGQALCEACQSREDSVRDRAFENLRNYLAEILRYAVRNTAGGADELRSEVLQQAMIEIFQSLRKENGGPAKPVAFFKWARVILLRQLSHCQSQSWYRDWLSLEAQAESVLVGLIDEKSVDPLDTLLRDERQAELKKAIATLRNPQYQAVLLNTFFSGLEERELAALWQVRVKDIYLWRFRALKALRKQFGVAEMAR